jgi:hypothetical protein
VKTAEDAARSVRRLRQGPSFGTARTLSFDRSRYPPRRKQANSRRLETALLRHEVTLVTAISPTSRRDLVDPQSEEGRSKQKSGVNSACSFLLSTVICSSSPSSSMAPSPPTYTSLSGNSSSSSHKNRAVFITLIVAPYALLSLLVPTTASLSRLLPFLFFSSVIHLYTHPYLIFRLFPSILPDSPEGQRKLWTGGNWQLASFLTLVVGLVGARMESMSEGQLGGSFGLFMFGGGVSFAAWNGGR